MSLSSVMGKTIVIKKLKDANVLLARARITGKYSKGDIREAMQEASVACIDACEILGLNIEEDVNPFFDKAHFNMSKGKNKEAKSIVSSNVGVFIDMLRKM